MRVRKFNLLPAGLLLLLLPFVFSHCKKTDQSIPIEELDNGIQVVTKTTEFFKYTGFLNPLTMAIRNYVAKEDAEKHFSSSYLEKVGKPIWNKPITFTRTSRIYTERDNQPGDSTITYFPITNNGRVTAALIVKIIGHDTTSKVVFANRYADFGFSERTDGKWNARDVFHVFAVLENVAFGTKTFVIKDDRLATERQRNLIKSHSSSGNDVVLTYSIDTTVVQQAVTSRLQEVYVCNRTSWCIKFDTHPVERGDVSVLTQPVPCLEWEYETECFSYWVDAGDSGGGTGGGGGEGGGGDGGGGGEWPDPCNDPTTPDGCGGSGWTSVHDGQLAAFQGMLETGDGFDFNVVTDATFETLMSTYEFESFKNGIGNPNNTTYDISTPATVINQNEKIQTAKFNLNFVGGVSVDVKLEHVNNLWKVKEVESDTWGFTPFVSWDQSMYSSSVTGNVLTVDMTGKMSYNVIIQGIGTIYKQEFRFQMKFNNITGEFISISRL